MNTDEQEWEKEREEGTGMDMMDMIPDFGLVMSNMSIPVLFIRVHPLLPLLFTTAGRSSTILSLIPDKGWFDGCPGSPVSS
ncbi:MAG: hypothetical protein WD042_07020 [Phycisphaeraceae bacterium]